MSNTSRMMQTAAAGLPGNRWTVADVERTFDSLGNIRLIDDEQQFVWKPDGSSYFILDNTSTTAVVREYSGPAAWETDPQTPIRSQSLTLSETMWGLAFKPDGTKMYTTNQTADSVTEWDLSTAWDVTTAVFLQEKTLGWSNDLAPCIQFKPDGTRMYVSRRGSTTATKGIQQFSLSTPWDVSTASGSVLFTEFFYVYGFTFSPLGDYLFLGSYSPISSNNGVATYALSSAWSINSNSYGGVQSNDVYNNPGFSVKYISFGDDGNKLFLSGYNSSIVSGSTGLFNFFLDSAYTIGTDIGSPQYPNYGASYLGLSRDTVATGWESLCFSSDGLNMYAINSYYNLVRRYTLSAPYNISNITNTQVLSNTIYDADIAISRDGTKLFTFVNEQLQTYTLPTPFSLSGAIDEGRVDLPYIDYGTSFVISEDGLKLIITDVSFVSYKTVFRQFSFGTAFDTSTLTYDGSSEISQSVSVAARAKGIRIDATGTKMLMVGANSSNTSFRVFDFTLAAPWDVVSAAPTRNNIYSVDDTGAGLYYGPYGLDVSPDGSYMYLPMRGTDLLLQYNLR